MNVPSDIRVGKNPENPTDHADDIDKERSPPPENPHDVELVISASPKIDAHDSEKHALIDANISETDPYFNTFVAIINHIKNLSPVQNEPLPTTPSVDFVETSMDKVVKKNNESSESPVSAPPGFETWADPEVNSTNIAIQHNTSDSPLSAPPGFELEKKSWADDCDEDANPATPKTSPENNVFQQEVELVLHATGISSEPLNDSTSQDDFQEVLSKSQKQKKESSSVLADRTLPHQRAKSRDSKMKVFYWNIRGIGNPRSQLEFSNFCRIHKPDFLCLSEPMVAFSSIPSYFWLSLNRILVAVNDRGSSLPNIWVLCNNSLDPTVICNSTQQVSIKIGIDNVTCCLSFVYASTNPYTRRQLWQNLSALSLNGGPWMVIGYFNAVLGAHEKKGGCPPLQLACREFKQMSDSCNLIHLNTTGSPFTWSNGWRSRGHIELRLDRSLCNSEWLDNWSHTNSPARITNSIYSAAYTAL